MPNGLNLCAVRLPGPPSKQENMQLTSKSRNTHHSFNRISQLKDVQGICDENNFNMTLSRHYRTRP